MLIQLTDRSVQEVVWFNSIENAKVVGYYDEDSKSVKCTVVSDEDFPNAIKAVPIGSKYYAFVVSKSGSFTVRPGDSFKDVYNSLMEYRNVRTAESESYYVLRIINSIPELIKV